MGVNISNIAFELGSTGPLPKQGGITIPGLPTNTYSCFLFVSGSCWTQVGNSEIGFTVAIDGNVVGVCKLYSNGNQTHRAVPPSFIPVSLTGGSHALTLTAVSGTLADAGDEFYATIIELEHEVER